MRLRSIITTALALLALAAGVAYAADNAWGPQSALQIAQQRETAPNRSAAKAPRRDHTATNPIDLLTAPLGPNRELIIYGAIASVGVLMMGLAIGNASSAAKKKTDAEFELLKQEKEKAENLARLKSEFLNQVSHELRTPLAVIIGYIECITDGLYGEIAAKHQEILQIVAKQSSHLKNMIDQILIYSRLEAGKQPVRIEELSLAKAIGELRDTFDFLCRQKGIELRWEVPREAMTIRSDTARVKEIVSNLLQNAVKYTDQGSITLRVAPHPSSDSVTIEVTDTGMGISEQNLSAIFEPFMQVHKTSSEHSRGGIGLGLSIVKKHLDQIRGTISVKSELGKGSTFRVVLPRSYDKHRSKRRWPLSLPKFRNREDNRVHQSLQANRDGRGEPAHTRPLTG
ncbi:MAG TPA: HAMP domain-containing sensor histidine kinase [Candidatus Binatia bacterium]|nr:HAMP domain-containing sensor histidine kinase [Candidatus Binatia bacterium]